jgi:cell division septum initiation protein DivIVA
MSDEHLLPMHDAEDAGGFDVVMRGYDRRQVEDYVERVEVALSDADRLHAEDGQRIAALEQELAALRERLAEAEHRAAGLPEPSSRVAARAAEILRLAEEEAEQIVQQARDKAVLAATDLNAQLERRSRDLEVAQAQADTARLDAQRDAEAVRARAKEESATLVATARADAEQRTTAAKQEVERLLADAQEEADRKLRTAEEDVAIIHEDGRKHARQLVEDAEAKVADLSRQRDAIAAQLQQLRETLAAALNPPTQ